MSRKISRSFINGRTGAGTAGQGLKVEWDSTNDGELHWLDVSESSLEAVVDGDRGVFSGGYAAYPIEYVDTIDYITISTTGDATDFGNLGRVMSEVASCSNATRGLSAGGYDTGAGAYSNIIEYITILTTGNATDFGDLTQARGLMGGALSNYTGDRGVFLGGRLPGHSYQNTMDYVTISSTGNATDFGDMLYGAYMNGSTSNSTNERGITGGGQTPGSTDTINYITISTTSNATDFGNLISAAKAPSATSNALSDRALWMGAESSSVIQYVTISSTGNATNFGDISYSGSGASCSNGSDDRAVMAGGHNGSAYVNNIEYVTISTTSNSTDFGDLSGDARNSQGGTADAGGN